MKIAVIDYGAGNIQSVCNALKKINIDFAVVTKASELEEFDKIIFTGVGAAGNAMDKIRKLGFKEAIQKTKKPFLGICLGMQLLAEFSAEGQVDCLQIVPGVVKAFPASQKTPQIGWNRVNIIKPSPLIDGLKNSSYFYFVNSYYFDLNSEYTVAKTNYGLPFPSIIEKDNYYAVQFHPEKSGIQGLNLLRNFCSKC